MQHANDAKYVVIAALAAALICACSDSHESKTKVGTGRTPATADHVTKEELATYLEWAVELRNQIRAAMADARQNMNDNEAFLAMFERRRREQTGLVAREPFKGTVKGKAINGVIQVLYASGTFVRDEDELEKARTRYGKELVDSVLVHERLIREKLDPDGAPFSGEFIGQ